MSGIAGQVGQSDSGIDAWKKWIFHQTQELSRLQTIKREPLPIISAEMRADTLFQVLMTYLEGSEPPEVLWRDNASYCHFQVAHSNNWTVATLCAKIFQDSSSKSVKSRVSDLYQHIPPLNLHIAKIMGVAIENSAFLTLQEKLEIAISEGRHLNPRYIALVSPLVSRILTHLEGSDSPEFLWRNLEEFEELNHLFSYGWPFERICAKIIELEPSPRAYALYGHIPLHDLQQDSYFYQHRPLLSEYYKEQGNYVLALYHLINEPSREGAATLLLTRIEGCRGTINRTDLLPQIWPLFRPWMLAAMGDREKKAGFIEQAFFYYREALDAARAIAGWKVPVNGALAERRMGEIVRKQRLPDYFIGELSMLFSLGEGFKQWLAQSGVSSHLEPSRRTTKELAGAIDQALSSGNIASLILHFTGLCPLLSAAMPDLLGKMERVDTDLLPHIFLRRDDPHQIIWDQMFYPFVRALDIEFDEEKMVAIITRRQHDLNRFVVLGINARIVDLVSLITLHLQCAKKEGADLPAHREKAESLIGVLSQASLLYRRRLQEIELIPSLSNLYFQLGALYKDHKDLQRALTHYLTGARALLFEINPQKSWPALLEALEAQNLPLFQALQPPLTADGFNMKWLDFKVMQQLEDEEFEELKSPLSEEAALKRDISILVIGTRMMEPLLSEAIEAKEKEDFERALEKFARAERLRDFLLEKAPANLPSLVAVDGAKSLIHESDLHLMISECYISEPDKQMERLTLAKIALVKGRIPGVLPTSLTSLSLAIKSADCVTQFAELDRAIGFLADELVGAEGEDCRLLLLKIAKMHELKGNKGSAKLAIDAAGSVSGTPKPISRQSSASSVGSIAAPPAIPSRFGSLHRRPSHLSLPIPEVPSSPLQGSSVDQPRVDAPRVARPLLRRAATTASLPDLA